MKIYHALSALIGQTVRLSSPKEPDLVESQWRNPWQLLGYTRGVNGRAVLMISGPDTGNAHSILRQTRRRYST